MDAPKRRENTFRIDFGHFPKKPNAREIHAFVSKRLGLTTPQVKRLQYHQTLGCAFVQCADLNTAQQTVLKHADNHEVTIENKKFTYKIRLEEAGTDVRIYELSPNISDEQIRAHMSQYGEVLSITELLWDDRFAFYGIPSGIRLLKMILKQHIESYVTIMGETSLVTYSGQIQTCRHCGERIHIGIPCTQNKKLLVQKMNINKQTSYAGAVKNKTNTPKDKTIPPSPVPPAPPKPTPTPPAPVGPSNKDGVVPVLPAGPSGILPVGPSPKSSLPADPPTGPSDPNNSNGSDGSNGENAEEQISNDEDVASADDTNTLEDSANLPPGKQSLKAPEQREKHKLNSDDDTNSDSSNASKEKNPRSKKPKKPKSQNDTNTKKPLS